MSTLPVDASARREFAEQLDQNFCVCAGAGVGKTTAIVDRIVNLAERRAQQPDILSRLVVVTYTQFAAEELRVRARTRLLGQLSRSAHDRQRLLGDLRRAFFGTIHSFCLRLIEDQGRFLGLPERVRLLPDEGKEADALWARFGDSEVLRQVQLPAAWWAHVRRHLTFNQLLELARKLEPTQVDALLAPADDAGEEEGVEDAGPDLHAPPPPLDFTAALAADPGRHPQGRPNTVRNQERLRRWQAEYRAGQPFLRLPEFADGSAAFLAAFRAARQPYARWVDAAAGRLAAELAAAWRTYRLEHGRMTYPDMVSWCRRLLDSPPVLRRLRERGHLVILDEAQDTDREMFTILGEITRPADAPLGGWPDDPAAPGPEPGRFCFVGDEQQAIYGQRADPAVYRRYVDAFRRGAGRRVEFSVTWRCPGRVVALVNAVFGAGRLDQADTEFRELAARPDAPEGGVWRLPVDPPAPGDHAPAGPGAAATDAGPPGPAGDAGPGSGGGPAKAPSVAAVLGWECAQVARLLAVRGPAGLGVARWEQVAVLAPRVDWLETAAEVFRRWDLPVNLKSRHQRARQLPAHSWPAALLHVLVNPWDRFELLGVLRELFAVSDVALARWHQAAPAGLSFWPRVDPLPAGDPRLARALALLHALRSVLPASLAAHQPPALLPAPAAACLPPAVAAGGAAAVGTLSRYVELVLTQSALADRLAAVGAVGGEAALERLRHSARQAECEGVPLRAWVQSLVEALEQPAPAQAAGPGQEDAIQLISCHKAKGLEWPVVIPVGLGRAVGQHTPAYPHVEAVGSGGGRKRLSVHFQSGSQDPAHQAAGQQRRREELQRLFYVTLTRARHLVILPDGAAWAKPGAASFFGLARWPELDWDRLPVETIVVPPAGSADASREAAAAGAPATSADPAAAAAVAAPRKKARPSGRRDWARAAAVSAQGPARLVPSRLVHGPQDDNPEERRLAAAEEGALFDAGEEEAERRLLGGEGGIDYGNWWHSVLQRYPWTEPAAARADYLRREQARVAPAAAFTSRAAAELERFAASSFHAGLVGSGRVFLPETPFSYPRGADLWIEGIMDLVVVTRDDALWVVDWKTDRRRAGESAGQLGRRLAEKYGAQLRAYAEVLAGSFKRPVRRRWLYATALGEATEVPDQPEPGRPTD